MTASVTHRGPDDAGFWFDESNGVAIGHRRLAVIDLSVAGHQPMRSADARWVLTYNGELYNTEAIRAQLPGVAWRGHSDTEVVLEAIARWGIEATVSRLNAMFALAAWDTETCELWLARDRFGEKPLCYGRVDGAWVFASEPAAITAGVGRTLDIDRDALALLLRFGSIPAPRSIWQGIRKLPAAHLVRLRPHDTTATPVRYWDPVAVATTARAQPVSSTEIVDELGRLISNAVRSRMVSDVPLGAFLSGGIDSSLVVATMQAHSSRPVRTFTIGFDDPAYDESPYARQVAAALGTDHTELRVTASDALSVISTLPTIYSEPFADSSQIPTFLVSQLARQHVTVALSGDGGDELFAGYDRYRVIERLHGLDHRIPASLRRAASSVLGGLASPRLDRIVAGRAGRVLPAIARQRPSQRADKLARLLGAPPGERYRALMSDNGRADQMVPGHSGNPASDYYTLSEAGFTVAEQAMLADTGIYLPDDLLTKVDRASMAVSLEVRIPLLDPEVYEFAWRLAPADRFREGGGKWPLRHLLMRSLPEHLIDRPKKGFGVPVGEWLRGPLATWAEDLLNPVALRRQGYLDTTTVRRLWQAHLDRTADHTHSLWSILMFQAWLQENSTVV